MGMTWNARWGGSAGPLTARGSPPQAPGAPLLLFGEDEVSQHVEGVAVGMHGHHLAVLLLDLKEPGVIQADYPHLWPLQASQADALATVCEE